MSRSIISQDQMRMIAHKASIGTLAGIQVLHTSIDLILLDWSSNQCNDQEAAKQAGQAMELAIDTLTACLTRR